MLNVPTFNDELGHFVITCQVTTCGKPHVIFSSTSQTNTHTFARKLIEKRVYAESLCPFECDRHVVSHAVDPVEEANIRDGIGSQLAGFRYPGVADKPRLGISSFQHMATNTLHTTMAPPFHREATVLSLPDCQAAVQRHRLLAMHALWTYNRTNGLGVRLGDCIFYHATRNTVQLQIWKAFFGYAKEVLNLAHFSAPVPSTFVSAISEPDDLVACNGDTSTVCMFWSEFTLDDESEVGCFPWTNGSNVATPPVILAELGSADLKYPPPMPPPPSPPMSPPPPVSPPTSQTGFSCNPRSLPSTTYIRDYNYRNATATNPFERLSKRPVCWRWDERGLWPPVSAHQDAYEAQSECGNKNSRSVRWDDDFRQSKLSSIYRSRLNEDSCGSESDPHFKNGVCEDGGKGDFTRFTDIQFRAFGHRRYRFQDPNDNLWYTEWEFMYMVDPLKEVPAVGQEIFVHGIGHWQMQEWGNGGEIGYTHNHITNQWGSDTILNKRGPDGSCYKSNVVNGNTVSMDNTPNAAAVLNCELFAYPLSSNLQGYEGGSRTPAASLRGFRRPGRLRVTANNFWRYYDNANGGANPSTEKGSFRAITADGAPDELTEPQMTCSTTCHPQDGLGRSGSQGLHSNAAVIEPRNNHFRCLSLDGNHFFSRAADQCFAEHDTGGDAEPPSYNLFAIGFSRPTPYCAYGTDRSDCGDRPDIVSWGWSASNMCFQEHWHFEDAAQVNRFWAGSTDSKFVHRFQEAGHYMGHDGNCNDGGASLHFQGRCPFGAECAG